MPEKQYMNYRQNLHYNYEVKVNDEAPVLFSTRNEIVEKYGISLSSIRQIIQNIRLGKVVKRRNKWEGYQIKNICIPKCLMIE